MVQDTEEFRRNAHDMVDWMAGYLKEIEKFPVKSQVLPGEIKNALPMQPPEKGEDMETIMDDMNRVIMPGITHWQSPGFFAYFPANSSFPSVLAEMLTATLGTQCMLWETSPAAAELEERMMDWLKNMLGLPEKWHGVIQDTASSATLVALLTAREKYTSWKINRNGFDGYTGFRVYASSEAHSSMDKAVKIAGLGHGNLVKIKTDEAYRMDPDELEKNIKKDLREGKKPLMIVATLGTTGTTSIDPLEKISEISRKYGTWLHVDAALAGSALLLDEYRWMTEGLEMADSFVFNPHKWLFTNFDCSAYFVKDPEALIRTFGINPEYLKTRTSGKVNDYRDWGIPLGRRFRALKLWFVIRNYGQEGLKKTIASHIQMAVELEEQMKAHPFFEMLAPRTMNTLCFRYRPAGMDEEQTNRLNEELLDRLNKTGKIYLTHTKLLGKYTLRLVIGQTRVEPRHVELAWQLIRDTARVLQVP